MDNHSVTDPKSNPPVGTESKRGSSWLLKTLFILAVGGTGILFLISTVLLWGVSRDLPKIITVGDYHPALVTTIVAGGPLAAPSPGPAPVPPPTVVQTPAPAAPVTLSAPSSVPPNVIGELKKDQKRYLTPIEKIPQIVIWAFISAEDDKFFEHPGINIMSMIRASIANFRAGHYVQGGSTITQQVAKSLLLSPKKDLSRKLKELVLAYRMERNLTKQQILYLYLNEIYLGHGAYGVEAASRTYFRKPASQISIAEAAILAGMPQAPGKYSPLLNPKKAKERQLYVLHRMKDNGYITQAQMSEAAAAPIKVYDEEDINNKYSPYLIEHIRRHMIEKYGEKATYEGGMTIYVPTTPQLSLAAKKSVRDGLEAVDKRIGYRGPLQHLRTREEVENFEKELRLKMIEDKLQCQIMMPDGTIDSVAAIQASGMQSDRDLLDMGKVYEAIVINVDDHKKKTDVMVGMVYGEIPFERLKWAKPARDEKNPQAFRPEPKVPSMVVKKGDVVLVKVISLPKPGSSDPVFLALDQEPQVQGALLSMEAKTGYVLAMEGGYDYDKSEFNRAIQALRQPGSSFKPIIYAAALERGYTPASVIVDSPIVYSDADQGKWKPSNFEEKFYGDTTFRQALIKSRNVPTIKIVQSLQVPYVIDYAKRLGYDTQFPMDLSISLGSASVSLLEQTKTYALFPRLGRKVNPIFYTAVIDRDGNLLEENKPDAFPATPHIAAMPSPMPQAGPATEVANSAAIQGREPIALPSYPPPDDPNQVMDPRVAYVMTHLMKEVVAYGTGHEAENLGRAAAGKTGTTNDYIDAWFMGFTPDVVTGVWVGFDNHRSIGPLETGARAALPIWLSYMRVAVQGYPEDDFQVPSGIVFASIDQNTGKLAPPNSLRAIQEAFIEGTQPTETHEKNSSSSGSAVDFFKEDQE